MTRENFPIRFSRRAMEVSPFLAMEVMERAKALEAEGRDIVYLCLGEPDFPTPGAVVEAAIRSLRGGETQYTHSLGRMDLREEIAVHYRRRYGVEVLPGQILVSSGTSPLMMLLFAALLEEGDEILLSDPSYACYPDFIRFVGGVPRFLRTREEEGFQPDPSQVRAMISPRVRGLLINSPSNPAGSVIPSDWLLGLAPPPAPPLSHQNFFISANSFVQYAGIVALRECAEDVARMRRAYDARRRHVVGRIRELGLGVKRLPAGAFFVLA